MIEPGSKVKVHFVGTLDDGRVFYSTHIQGGVPMEFIVGKQQILPALEHEITSMQIGGRKTVTIPAREAYGEYDPTLVETVSATELSNADNLPVGGFVVFNTESGPLRVKVASVEDDCVTFDYNHELAGQNLTFTIDLLGVMSARERSIEHEEYYREDGCGCKHILGSHDENACGCGHDH